MTHFLPPDMRDPAVAQTYSGYGYTKLENYTWYFYLAGKIALLFKTMFCSLAYYRVPNLLLFAALTFYFVRNIRQKNWLMVALGICVQSWYIFPIRRQMRWILPSLSRSPACCATRRVCFIAS